LQRLGLDFLSSVHWIVIIVIALLFAAFVVLLKRHRAAESAKQIAENDALIESGRQALQTRFFLPDGRLNTDLFPAPQHTTNDEVFASDAINEKINSNTSQKILPQLRRYVKSGKLFSFFNSMASANDKVSAIQRRLGGAKPVIDKDQQLANSLRARYGGDQLRNPLIDKQIADEVKYRRQERQQEQTTLEQQQQQQQQQHQQQPLKPLNASQLETLDAAFS
jgi:hypothetical protein